jgi:hypothetical protein
LTIVAVNAFQGNSVERCVGFQSWRVVFQAAGFYLAHIHTHRQKITESAVSDDSQFIANATLNPEPALKISPRQSLRLTGLPLLTSNFVSPVFDVIALSAGKRFTLRDHHRLE